MVLAAHFYSLSPLAHPYSTSFHSGYFTIKVTDLRSRRFKNGGFFRGVMKDYVLHAIIIVLILGSTVLLLQREPVSIGGFPLQQRDTVSVTGTAELDVTPDEAQVIVVVETEGVDAKEAQQKNSEISNKVIQAVVANGVKKDMIDTIGYYLQKIESYHPQTGQPIPLGYRQGHTMKIVVQHVDEAGEVVDAAVGAGANRVQGLSFTLSRELELESQQKALKMAAERAREKAEVLASSLGVMLGDAITISETNFIFQPQPYDYGGFETAGAVMEKTQVLPKDVTLSLSVNVVFEIR